MLRAIRKSDGESVIASGQQKFQAPFNCPECGAEVILHKGSFKTPHFAHKPPVLCAYGSGESEEHRRCKLQIYESLLKSSRVTQLELERPLGTVRPDIIGFINGLEVAIEVQISSLSLEVIARRTKDYARRNITLLWLGQWNSALDEERYSPRPWEKWMHAAYFGRVYYWRQGSIVTPYHFGEYSRHVPSAEFYSEDGEEQSFGGFIRRYKRYRTPMKGPDVDLLEDFERKRQKGFEGPKLQIPPALLYCDRSHRFW